MLSNRLQIFEQMPHLLSTFQSNGAALLARSEDPPTPPSGALLFGSASRSPAPLDIRDTRFDRGNNSKSWQYEFGQNREKRKDRALPTCSGSTCKLSNASQRLALLEEASGKPP